MSAPTATWISVCAVRPACMLLAQQWLGSGVEHVWMSLLPQDRHDWHASSMLKGRTCPVICSRTASSASQLRGQPEDDLTLCRGT